MVRGGEWSGPADPKSISIGVNFNADDDEVLLLR